MKSITILAFAAGLALTIPCRAATYSFSGFFGEPLPPGQTDYTATFDFTIPGEITSDTTIAASSMSECMTHASPCVSATFYMDSAAAGLSSHSDWEALGLSTSTTTAYYYFEGPAFGVDGTHADVDGDGPATLTVSASAVPEPASLALIGLGLPLLLVASVKRRRARKR